MKPKNAQNSPPAHSPLRYLIGTAAFVVIIAGLHASRQYCVMILLAAFLAVILFPVLDWLRRKGISSPVALVLIMSSLLLIGFGVVAIVGTSVNSFNDELPEFKTQLVGSIEGINSWVNDNVVQMPDDSAIISADSDAVTGAITSLFSELTKLFSNGILILIVVIFMLLEANAFPQKLASAIGRRDPWNARIQRIADDVRRYMVIKTRTSLATGLLVAGLLWCAGVSYPLMWGLLAFLFNFVPNIGSIIAAVPAVLLTLIQHGPVTAIVVAVGYLAINCAISYAVEPRYMGHGLGLSPLVVFLSLLFWGWVLGPVGMFLSAPLTMIVKIVLESRHSTRWIATLLGNRSAV